MIMIPIPVPDPTNEDPGNTKLFQDINSGELLFAPSSDPDTQTLLTNQDSSSFEIPL